MPETYGVHCIQPPTGFFLTVWNVSMSKFSQKMSSPGEVPDSKKSHVLEWAGVRRLLGRWLNTWSRSHASTRKLWGNKIAYVQGQLQHDLTERKRRAFAGLSLCVLLNTANTAGVFSLVWIVGCLLYVMLYWDPGGNPAFMWATWRSDRENVIWRTWVQIYNMNRWLCSGKYCWTGHRTFKGS